MPVPIVPTELFSQSLQVSSSPNSTHGNVSAIIQTQQQHSQLQHQQQQQVPPQQESNPDLVSFQICPQQAEMIYANIDNASSNQQ